MGIQSNRDIGSRSQSISKREFLTLAGATAAGLLIGSKSAHGDDGTLCLINGLLIDGTGADAIPDGAIVIRDGRILAAGPRSQVMIPSIAKMVEGSGCFSRHARAEPAPVQTGAGIQSTRFQIFWIPAFAGMTTDIAVNVPRLLK